MTKKFTSLDSERFLKITKKINDLFKKENIDSIAMMTCVTTYLKATIMTIRESNKDNQGFLLQFNIYVRKMLEEVGK